MGTKPANRLWEPVSAIRLFYVKHALHDSPLDTPNMMLKYRLGAGFRSTPLLFDQFIDDDLQHVPSPQNSPSKILISLPSQSLDFFLFVVGKLLEYP